MMTQQVVVDEIRRLRDSLAALERELQVNVAQIEAFSPTPDDQPCKCGACRHSRGVTRIIARAEAAEAELAEAKRERDEMDGLRDENFAAMQEAIGRAETAELALDAATKANARLREALARLVDAENWADDFGTDEFQQAADALAERVDA